MGSRFELGLRGLVGLLDSAEGRRGRSGGATSDNIVCVKTRGAASSFTSLLSGIPLAFLPSLVFNLRIEAEYINHFIPGYSNELLDG